LGVVAAGDRFEGYAAERTEILKFINDNDIENVVFVAADIHGTLVNNLTYQEFPGGPQIATTAFEITTGAVAYDQPFGQTVVRLAAGLGLLSPAQVAFYNSLPIANDGDSVPNDKDDFLKLLVNGQLATLGYDAVGLNANLPAANGLIDATLIQGDYAAVHTYGWSDFRIDPETQELRVITYGIEEYTADEVAADPENILARTPSIVSEFGVQPTLPAAAIRGNSAPAATDTIGRAASLLVAVAEKEGIQLGVETPRWFKTPATEVAIATTPASPDSLGRDRAREEPIDWVSFTSLDEASDQLADLLAGDNRSMDAAAVDLALGG